MNTHWGARLDDIPDEEGIREVAKAEAVVRVIAWQRSMNGASASTATIEMFP